MIALPLPFRCLFFFFLLTFVTAQNAAHLEILGFPIGGAY